MSKKENKVRFFKENFLLTNVKPNKVLEIFFLIISNTNVNFKIQDLQ